ncbi:MAG: HAMP domain-containing sensor histidine kinase [Planctomycetota bacterium]|nr:HAMP domain-containing sensor histidine kinase [Planctomycetota bacterium]
MSDQRIIKLSHAILESAIDEWNRVLSQGTPGDPKALLELIHQARSRIPELFDAVEPSDPVSLGKGGLLAWLLWFSNRLDESQLSHQCKSPLKQSLLRAISILSSGLSVHEAIETAARRQTYELAYGLSHEINNPLGNILARAQQLLSKATDPQDRKSLATVVDQAMRAHEMLAEIMRAVQPQKVQCLDVDLISLVKQAYARSEPLAKPKNLAWRLRIDQVEAQAHVDAAGVLEALRLIAQNAIDACRQSDTIEWSVEIFASSIHIAIQDTGPGLSPQALRRAWDLCYSGREAGRGLGLSLAVVRRLVTQSGGTVRLTSEKQLGCRVDLKFPKRNTGDDQVDSLKPRKAWKV